MTSAIIASIRQELSDNIDTSRRDEVIRYFKEPVTSYGLKNSAVNQLAARYYAQVKGRETAVIYALCEELFKSDYNEEAFIACDWAARLEKRYAHDDFYIFEHWVHDYINNWAKCDTLCNHAVGSIVMQFPEFIANLKRWTGSDNRWVRRAAAVTLVLPARRGLFLDDVFDIADRLLTDADGMVQKGYGWMLKEASKRHQQEVFDYIVRHKAVMPRTALRYAIEKMPPELRKQAMSRD